MNSRRPGRKRNLSMEELETEYQIWKPRLYYDAEMKKLKSKENEIWLIFSKELGGKLKQNTLYSRVCDIRNKKPISISNYENKLDASSQSTDVENNSGLAEDLQKFTIYSNKVKYEELLIEKLSIRRETKSNKEYMRHGLRLDPGKWENWITNEIWDSTKLSCSFNFRGHSVTDNGNFSTMQGMSIEAQSSCMYAYIRDLREKGLKHDGVRSGKFYWTNNFKLGK